ncbi:MAG: DMT family transporter [Alphaproteobacteria bacterium]
MSDNLRGGLWILLSCLAATMMTVGVRALSVEMQSMEIAFARSLVGLMLVLPVVVARGSARLRTKRWKLHLLRGVLGVVALNCGFYALTKLPLATVTVLFFTAPLFVTIFARSLLGERVGWRRWAATAVGFLGTLVVMQPGTAGFHPVMMVAVGSSVIFALVLIIGKKLSTTESPYTMMLYAGVIMSLGCLPPALAVWRTPSPVALLLMLMVGAFGALRSYFDIRGYATGEASFVASFQYTRIILAAAAGFVFFAETPEGNALFGAAIIIASTLYIAQRERRLGRAATARTLDP